MHFLQTAFESVLSNIKINVKVEDLDEELPTKCGSYSQWSGKNS